MYMCICIEREQVKNEWKKERFPKNDEYMLLVEQLDYKRILKNN